MKSMTQLERAAEIEQIAGSLKRQADSLAATPFEKIRGQELSNALIGIVEGFRHVAASGSPFDWPRLR